MKRLRVTVQEIICKDPQDPRYDELYFVVATNNVSQVSSTIRRIGRGVTKPCEIIFDEMVDERSPILITALEQRAVKDNSKAVKVMEYLAAQGVEFADDWLKNNPSSLKNMWREIGDFLLTNLISLVKLIFRDSPLLNKVITEPYKDDVTYPVIYVMKGKSDSRPTYDYEIKFTISYK